MMKNMLLRGCGGLLLFALLSVAAYAGPDWNAMRQEIKQIEQQAPWVGKAKTFEQMQDLANNGNWVARVGLCQAYFDEDSPVYDTQVGAVLARDVAAQLEELADQGDPDAQFHLAGFYASGWGVEKDNARVMDLLRRSADSGCAAAQAELGRRYINGIGMEEDAAEADRFLNQALESRDPDACFLAAFCYADPFFSYKVRDLDKALHAYTVAAESGNALSASCLADLYKAGEKVPQDLEKAAYWQRKAAELGWGGSAWDLAEEALERKDYETAVSWYKKSAETGFALACGKLAEMYESGEGVVADPAEAAAWREKAETLRRVEAMNTAARGEAEKIVWQNKAIGPSAGEDPSPMHPCENNLRMLDAAKQQWALENGRGPDDVPSEDDLTIYFSNETYPQCPDGGVYTINGLSQDPACSVHGSIDSFDENATAQTGPTGDERPAYTPGSSGAQGDSSLPMMPANGFDSGGSTEQPGESDSPGTYDLPRMPGSEE